MNLLCWNCRGIGTAPTVQELRGLAIKFSPSSGVSAENLKSTLGFDNYFSIDSSGRSGGLVMY